MSTTTAVSLEVRQDVAVVTASGEIDMATAPLLVERCGAIPEGTPRVVLDLTQVTFLDSSGLGAIIACQKRYPALVVVVREPKIAKLFDITGLREVIPTVSSLEEAVAPSGS
jgi:anti-sigma B factor antagonist